MKRTRLGMVRSSGGGRRLAGLAGLAFIASSFVGFSGSARAATANVVAKDAAPLGLFGVGAYGVERQMVDWRNAMFDVQAPVSFLGRGTADAQGEFLNDPTTDFLISGKDFTAAELAAAPTGSTNFVKIPFHISAGGFLFRRPPLDTFPNINNPNCDPFGVDPTVPFCYERVAIVGPLKIPARNIAAMSFGLSPSSAGLLSSWSNPDTLKSLGLLNVDVAATQANGPVAVSRADRDASSYWLNNWIDLRAPDVVDIAATTSPKIIFRPINDLNYSPATSRTGVSAQVSTIAYPGLLGYQPGSTLGDPGTIGFTPPDGLQLGKELTAPQPTRAPVVIEFLPVQNAQGDWLEPTPDSISKAAVAGGETPLYAAKNKVPGAYPIVWTDYLYARTDGLTIDKVNALSGFIRFSVTDGQNTAAASNNGRLSPALVSSALSAADRFVAAACTGSDRVVVVTAGAPFHPTTAGVTALGKVSACGLAPVPTTTTTTAATTTILPDSTTTDATTTTTTRATVPTETKAVLTAPRPVATSSVLGATATNSTTSVPDATTTDVATTTTPAPAPVIVDTSKPYIPPPGAMPLPAPNNGSGGHDRFASMAIGSALLWVARKRKQDGAM